MRTFLTTMCVAGLIGCGDVDDSGLDAPEGATVFTLTPAGGTFEGEGDLEGFRLSVPPEAVSADLELWMAPPASSPPLPDTGVLVGPEIEFGPGRPTLALPAELTLPFEPSRVMQAGVALQFVKVWRVGPDGWEIQDPVAQPAEGGDGVTVSIDTLSHFGAGVEIEPEE